MKGALNKNERVGFEATKGSSKKVGIEADKACLDDNVKKERVCTSRVKVNTPIGGLELNYENKTPLPDQPKR